MKQLAYSARALQDLEDIAHFIAEASQNREVADRFLAQLTAKCATIARAGAALGRPRGELRTDMRSLTAGNYLIFFRYDQDAVQIIRIIERHRDIAGQFEPEEA